MQLQQGVKDLCTVYIEADESDKLKFFTLLGSKYGVDHGSITALANSLSTCTVRICLEEFPAQWFF